MTDTGINVLRNESTALEIEGQSLRFVGMGDLWSKDLDPKKAFAEVSDDEAVIVLAHNPQSIEHMEEYKFDILLSGHTHGIPFQFSRLFGAPFLNWHNYHAGLYALDDKKLYVNRGLGRLGSIVYNAKPEITLITLRQA